MKNLFSLLSVLACILLFTACSSEDGETQNEITNIKSYKTFGISSSSAVSDTISLQIGERNGKKVLVSYHYKFPYKITEGMSSLSGTIEENKYNNAEGLSTFPNNEAIIDIEYTSLSLSKESHVKFTLGSNNSVRVLYELNFSDERIGKATREANCDLQ